MRRNVNLEEITDGKLYMANDMVKVDCHGCSGCSACCRGMGESISLDPYDMWQLTSHLKMGFADLFEKYIGLHVEDGLLIPHLLQMGEEEKCAFLKDEERCEIHAFRPGICRLFPLGRIYDESGLRYIHQIYECPQKDRTKVKIKKWLGISDLKRYEQYIGDWHDFIVICREALGELSAEEGKILVMFLLRSFYQTDYTTECLPEAFYEEFYSRLKQAKETLGLLEKES